MVRINKVIDISMIIEENMRLFPGQLGPSFTRIKTHHQHGRQVTKMDIIVHAGTHVDAPYHFCQDGETIDQVSPDKLIGEAVVLDLKYKSPGGLIMSEDFGRFREDLKKNDIVILNTGYEHYLDPSQYCSLSPEAAQWLVNHKIKCLAADIPSVDPLSDLKDIKASKQTHPAHHIILNAGIPIVECLVNLDSLTSKRVFFCCLFLKISNSDGAPARAIVMEFE